MKKKAKSKNMIVNAIKISQKMKNKSQLSIGKDIMKCKRIKMGFKLSVF